jgi:hypothetical protein
MSRGCFLRVVDVRGRLATRRDFRSVICVLGALLAVMWGGGSRMDAHQASPFADREVPDPALCHVAPRSIDFFQQLAATPMAGPRATPASPPRLPTIAGKPAGEETVAGIHSTVRELIACRNLGDQLRVDALYSDDYFFRQAATSGPPSSQFVEFLASSPVPLPEAQRAAICGVRDVRELPDGRVSALIGLYFPPDDVAFLDVFVREGERWLIDEESVVPFDTLSLSTVQP